MISIFGTHNFVYDLVEFEGMKIHVVGKGKNDIILDSDDYKPIFYF